MAPPTHFAKGLWALKPNLVTIYVGFSWKNILSSHNFCTCPDNWAVVTCANLWPDWIYRYIINAKRIFTLLVLRDHKYFVKWVPYSGCVGVRFTLITAWISNYIHYKVWDKIMYPFPNFNDATLEVWEWIINFILPFTRHCLLMLYVLYKEDWMTLVFRYKVWTHLVLPVNLISSMV